MALSVPRSMSPMANSGAVCEEPLSGGTSDAAGFSGDGDDLAVEVHRQSFVSVGIIGLGRGPGLQSQLP